MNTLTAISSAMVQLDEAAYRLVMSVPEHRKKYLFVLAMTLVSTYVARRKLGRSAARNPLTELVERRRVHRKVGVDAQFLAQLKKIVPICVPGVASKECALLVSLAGILIARTWLDIWFSSFNGVVVRSIVSRDWQLFTKNALFLFGMMMWPMSVVNNSLKLNINMLALAFRSRLTHYAHDQYLKAITFYKVANLDNRIQNADQLLTQDIDKFSETMTHLYSDIAKPIVDIGLFAYKLGQSIGAEAPLMMLAYFVTSGVVLRAVSPPFGKYTAIEQNLEGELRYNHSRIIAHSEEIAFYRGGEREKQIANGTFQRIKGHLRKVFVLRFTNGIIDSVLVKYCATQLAFFILSRPVFGRNAERYSKEVVGTDSTKIMEDYSTNSGYLINLSQAVGRLVLAGRDLTRFAGYTFRVSEFFAVLEDINSGRYQRTMVSTDPSGINEVRTIDQGSLDGQIVEMDGVIEFKNVPICTPNGDILVPSMSFRVESGMNCLITGPNGCGKSSLFRILGGLWPIFGGVLTKPSPRNMFYVPQKPYLTLGTLRDQLIYPDVREDATKAGFDDANLMALLGKVNLEYLVSREGGWDAVRDWADVLSGGEKQRVAMARLFYHRPQFAILDECTSAVSMDVEGQMYRYARELGITLFTVSHRPSLVPYHEFLLRFDGQGNYEFEELKHDGAFAFARNNGDSSPSRPVKMMTEGPYVGDGHDYFEEEEGELSDDELE
ncbi:ATP-binding cassette, subfamily D (ALD), member 3 [Paramicrosporidium saccamoebae]|uniref:ATP-binding cassette, subfamily D (ALD), member 3 n=1 Tax=Paramicrosporidium saccamoebae TaxID=1246581 RepID=A0A2H9THZ6_9FUNG|nr:ATP-binding cassette, subfamily D (ALD), member 3 [Paramicrosporidium saccamoebae]